MKIGLIDVDGHNFPNLPLMKISAWHKKQGNSVEWYSPLFSPKMDKIYMSKVFSFSLDYNYPINAKEIIKGGSGYCIQLENKKEIYHKEKESDLPEEIEHIYPDYSIYPQFTKNIAYGFLSRGCPRKCEFCHVAKKEGCHSYKVADLSEFWKGQKKIILCDPNILACPDQIDLLYQLAESKAQIEFNQGLDIRLINDKNIDILKKIKIINIHFAFDRYQDNKIIKEKMHMVKEATGWNRTVGKPTVYILVNFDTTLEQDIERIQFCRSLGWSPYPMIYDKTNAAPVYRKLQRWCNNFIFWKVPQFKDYLRNTEK